jgi:hypothetical protein
MSIASTYPEQSKLQRLDKHKGKLELCYSLLDLVRMVIGHLGHIFPSRIRVLFVHILYSLVSQASREKRIAYQQA